jgi:hypothetical protein
MEKREENKAGQDGFLYPPIVERYYEFCHWLLPKVSKFKKDQKYILGSRLQNTALDALECIISAAISDKKQKFKMVEVAIIKLEHLRFFMRLSVQGLLLSERSFLYGSEQVLHVLKMLSGWKKSLANAQ